ncbi:N-alpha-acetyltransferase 15, NatA auxiliary subunit [Quaeritorhiza haematococci]|nr:N-alpha-acetyltransferase 15, NatA auxiliary subunit [Quaeritorhiza haematococci]
MASAQKKPNRYLPQKEAALYKNALRFYEHKQYKKGLKTTDQILRKCPDHGETLAMKGLFCSHLDRKEEGFDLIRKGLKNDITSQTCWHVYGLVHRADKNYEEASKCYANALKFDKDPSGKDVNMNLVRDYSLLQIQMRNYETFNETRHQLLSLRPANRMYWLGLAISYHLLHKYETAEKVLAAYEETLKEQPEGVLDFDHSEMLLYKNQVIEESGEFEKALKHLEEIEKKVLDKRAWKETKGRLLEKLGRVPEAESVWHGLLRENWDCKLYLDSLLRCRGLTLGSPASLTSEESAALVKALDTLLEEFPKSSIIKNTPLRYSQGEDFRTRMNTHLVYALRKGIPSLWVSIKDLYTDASKSKIIGEIVQGYYKNLKEHGRFTAPTSAEEKDVKEPPTAFLWTMYFLAQHFDNRWSRDTKKALETIDEALEHTPTSVELHMCKARILKHAGDIPGAASEMERARELDLQDRFINSKATKYLLRAGELEKAENVVKLFARTDSTDPLSDLVDMQCMWYALEAADMHAKNGRYGKALKKYHQIEKHFIDIYDDQFDFHSYCLRKTTLRSYISLLRLEDRLRNHPFYFKAAVGAVGVYLRLWEERKAQAKKKEEKEGEKKKEAAVLVEPLWTKRMWGIRSLGASGKGADGKMEDGADDSSLSAAERKKAARKARKAELKNQENTKPNGTTTTSSSSSTSDQKKDAKSLAAAAEKQKKEEEEEAKLLKLNEEDAEGALLKEAVGFLKGLQEFGSVRIEGWVLGVEVFLRMGKILLALRSLKKAYRIDPSNPDVHRSIVWFWREVTSRRSTLNPTILKVIDSEFVSTKSSGRSRTPSPKRSIDTDSLSPLFPSWSSDLKSFNKFFLEKNKGSAEHVLAGAEVLAELGDVEGGVKALKGVLDGEVTVKLEVRV